MDVKTSPLVAIRCITYNHEPYIRDALDGFVMQKTNFPFVAIVHDDASTDGTADIIREYAAKYPDIIKPIYETENQYSRRDGSLSRIMNEACAKTGAKYYALCEGDDYWTDPLKLQKQVDFLEAHTDYSMCFHNCIVHWEDNKFPDKLISEKLEYREYSGAELWNKYVSQTASLMLTRDVYSAKLYKKAKANPKIGGGDWALILGCATCGKIFCIPEVMSVYRRNPGSLTYTAGEELRLIVDKIELSKIFGDDYRPVTEEYCIPPLVRDFYAHLRRWKWIKAFRLCNISFRYSRRRTLKELCIQLKNYYFGASSVVKKDEA